jgi:hypothetical protein
MTSLIDLLCVRPADAAEEAENEADNGNYGAFSLT